MEAAALRSRTMSEAWSGRSVVAELADASGGAFVPPPPPLALLPPPPLAAQPATASSAATTAHPRAARQAGWHESKRPELRFRGEETGDDVTVALDHGF